MIKKYWRDYSWHTLCVFTGVVIAYFFIGMFLMLYAFSLWYLERGWVATLGACGCVVVLALFSVGFFLTGVITESNRALTRKTKGE